jgi:N-acetylmuramoyl-L-alanine amidase
MFSSFRTYLAVVFVVVIFMTPWIATNYPNQARDFVDAFGNAALQIASVIFHNPRTIAELKEKYASTPNDVAVSASSLSLISSNSISPVGTIPTMPPTKVKILLVPGHEPGFGGTEFGNIKERLMNTELASDLQDLLQNDPHFEVIKTRNNETWDPIFSKYFKDQWSAIVKWQKESHTEMKHLIAIGSTTKAEPKVYHNSAPTNVALRLYGITKWANENGIDVVIHIHFNDFPDHRDGVAGEYTGFSIYVPVGQFANSTTTKAVASAVFKRLATYNSVSTLPGESSGIVDEPELIAIGANNTADAASMLIEYGYIYEPQFRDAATRSLTLKNLAQETYLGLKDFFESRSGI